MSYSFRMDTDKYIGSAVAEAIRQAERTQIWVADKARMTPTTLRKKIRGGASFTVTELQAIAEALNIPPSSLLPQIFHEADERLAA